MLSSVVTVPRWQSLQHGRWQCFLEHTTAVAVTNIAVTAKNVKREMHVAHPLNVDT